VSENLINMWQEGQVGWIEINNPPVNILTTPSKNRLLDALREMPERGVRCIVITGAGERSFCAGADLGEEKVLNETTVLDFVQKTQELQDTVDFCPTPIIAAINGHCMGAGLSLALCCDIRVASENARFRSPGVRVGLVANVSRLVRLIGEARTKELALTGRDFFADEAYHLGLVSKVVSIEQLRQAARDMAETICSRAPLAVRGVKKICNASANLSFEELIEMERQERTHLGLSRDHKHAIERFFNKQEPEFIGE